jgi:hypothetical protein
VSEDALIIPCISLNRLLIVTELDLAQPHGILIHIMQHCSAGGGEPMVGICCSEMESVGVPGKPGRGALKEILLVLTIADIKLEAQIPNI